MTEKEKAVAYDEAIKRAKKLHDNRIAEEIFPELKESEDERIRRAILNGLIDCRDAPDLGWSNFGGIPIDNCITWLEKQSEKFTDKHKPKFNVDDWIIFIRFKSIYKVEKIENDTYTLRDVFGNSLCLSFSNEKDIRKWNIQDTKDGDVLVDEDNNIGIFKKCEDTYWHSYIYLGCDSKLRGFSIGGIHKQSNTNPATKKQIDTLMKAINDAGYEWDAENKELKKRKLEI